jgi:hypothetical protein
VWSEPEEQFFFIGRDITERTEADRLLRESEARLALAAEITEIAIGTAERSTLPARIASTGFTGSRSTSRKSRRASGCGGFTRPTATKLPPPRSRRSARASAIAASFVRYAPIPAKSAGSAR